MTDHNVAAPSSAIEIAGLRQIFVWPLALDLADGDAGHRGDVIRDRLDRVAADFAKVPEDGAEPDWTEIHDLLDHAGAPIGSTHRRRDDGVWVAFEDPTGKTDAIARKDAEAALKARLTDRGQSYAEFVYFYDFLQSILFPVRTADDETTRPPVRLFRHRTLDEIEFDLHLPVGPTGSGTMTYRADVERLSVYLFDSGAAVVVLEIDFGAEPKVMCDPNLGGLPRALTLADTLTINDHLRRVYTPFFFGQTPARVPKRFAWRLRDRSGGRDGTDGAPPLTVRTFAPKPLDPAGIDDDFAFVRAGSGTNRVRSAPIADHWRSILSPLRFVGYDDRSDAPRWRHVLDERIPLMSFVSLTGAARAHDKRTDKFDWDEEQRRDYGLVGRGDWVRLCSADEAGADQMPYAPRFLEAFEKDAYYDRFAADPTTTSASRILFGGYHFSMVGAGYFFDTVMVHHFRRHYFQMMLIANLELASLLVTSRRISEAVDHLQREKADKGVVTHSFMDDLEDISKQFLTFVHRYRFTGVSNQIQPTELFARMRRSMNLDALFADVKAELEASVSLNSTYEQRRIAEEQQKMAMEQAQATLEQGRIAASGERLSYVATVGAAIGLAMTLLSISMIGEPLRDLLKYWVGVSPPALTQLVPPAADPTLPKFPFAATAVLFLSITTFCVLFLVFLSKAVPNTGALPDDDARRRKDAARRILPWLAGLSLLVSIVLMRVIWLG